MRARLLAPFLLSGWACASMAAPPQKELNATMEALKASQQKAEALSKEYEALSGELGDLEQTSRKLVEDIRAQQAEIADNRERIAALKTRQQAKSRDLEARKGEIATLLRAMLRLQRLPRHYVAAQPADMQRVLKSASALHISYAATQQQFEAIQAEFAQLAALEAQLKSSQLDLSGRLQAVKAQHKILAKTLSERRQLQQSLRRDHQQVKARVAKLSDESENLQQLIAKLEAETLLFKREDAPKGKADKPSKASLPLILHKGGMRYPAQGRLLGRFGEVRQGEEVLEGIEIATESSAPVTAPHGGRVVYSGEFMDYGPMVIIEHDKQYHSVIAGMDVVEVEPGDSISSGGIIGVMGASEASRKLYFELRKNSKPIDPSEWMSNVSQVARTQ